MSAGAIAEPKIFNSNECFVEGWYWAVASRDLKRGQTQHLELMGRNLAIYRGEDGVAVCLDAYCPHMGAHLAEGTVEGTSLRCFFHNWKFSDEGQCEEVPSLGRPVKACVKRWPTDEKYGMVWVWTGPKATSPIPHPPELEGYECSTWVSDSWIKECHPNVVMVNAIDAHHFNTVHNLPIDVVFEKRETENGAIHFENQTRGGEESLFVKLIAPLYAGRITYDLCYWFGSSGTVTVGPDFFHFYIMFSSRMLEGGKAHGRTILLTKKRPGFLGWLVSTFALFAAKIVGDYFATGDTQIFRTIRFKLQTPVRPDKSILQFAHHIEKQPARSYGDWSVVENRPEFRAVYAEDSEEGISDGSQDGEAV